jgi:hypothetical protein
MQKNVQLNACASAVKCRSGRQSSGLRNTTVIFNITEAPRLGRFVILMANWFLIEEFVQNHFGYVTNLQKLLTNKNE